MKEMRVKILLICLTFPFLLPSCTYLKYASAQAEYARIQDAEPGQVNVKHMIDRETYFLIGLCNDAEHRYGELPKIIVAFSSKYRANEQVDSMYFEVAGSHYGLNLPEGNYDLLVFADLDASGSFDSYEVVGKRSIEVNDLSVPDKVLGQVDIQLSSPIPIDWNVSIDVPSTGGRVESLFYPSGTIRSLDDPIFDSNFSTLGMYDPASFMEQAPTAFYALEEDIGYKIPVVFVHGIAGSARDFATLVDQLDRQRYKPFFFHYASGEDLGQLAELFYKIYLEGNLYRSDGMPMIVIAHSMGGLVVREAINRYKGRPNENHVRLFVTMATPFGGHAKAASGEKHGLIVIPSWRDLNPASPFIGKLFRKPLPEFVHHELIYAYQNPGTIKLGENSDGVVTLTSQLYPPAQRQASGQFGFDNTHTSILESEEVGAHIMERMGAVKNTFPQSQLDLLWQGGYDVELDDTYSPRAQYSIHTYGKYLMALSNEAITTFHPEEDRFIAVVKGEKKPRDDTEEGWLRFLREYPEFRNDY